ncbi:MAG: ABC transporter ATP-binding protein [Ignavibacteriales bacterium]|nr:ABC transporter ATP-binding protein [Ignavibacteriales bacterium]
MEITLDRFSFHYAPSQQDVVSGITMGIPKGSCCAVLGPTGAGKTTLLLAISGALAAHYSSGVGEGEIAIGPKVFRPMPDKILFPEVGLALQESHLMISGLHETVRGEVGFSLENIGTDTKVKEEKIVLAMENVGILHLAERNPFMLSGGELQRVVLAALLAVQPAVLLLDEPSNSLDAEATAMLVRILRGLHKNTTVVFSDHQLDLAILVADRFLVLQDGEMVFFGEKKPFLKNLEQFKGFLPVDQWSKVIPQLSRKHAPHIRLLSRLLEIR